MTEVTVEEGVVAVAPLDYVEIWIPTNMIHRRSNEGAGTEMVQMDFYGKGH